MSAAALFALALLAFQDAPKYRYELQVEPAKPGATLYAYTAPGRGVPFCKDAAALADAHKSLAAGDAVGFRELLDAGRLELIPSETGLRVLQHRAEPGAYEVRVTDGPAKDKKGFVLAGTARKRVPADAPAEKPKARPKRKR